MGRGRLEESSKRPLVFRAGGCARSAPEGPQPGASRKARRGGPSKQGRVAVVIAGAGSRFAWSRARVRTQVDAARGWSTACLGRRHHPKGAGKDHKRVVKGGREAFGRSRG